jgi:hypothetical protein
MGRRMHLAQAAGINTGVDLCGRERSVAEQGLDRAEICPGSEEMRGKGMAQGMRGRRVRQAEQATQTLDQALDQARVECAAFRAPEQGLRPRQGIRALLRIDIDRLLAPPESAARSAPCRPCR